MKKQWLQVFILFVPALAFAQTRQDIHLTPYEIKGKSGYINSKGTIVIKPRFDFAEPFSEGYARVSLYVNKRLRYGFIDIKGSFVILPQYAEAHDFAEGLASVRREERGEWEYVDPTGRTVIKINAVWAYDFSEGLAEILLKNGKSGYIDKSGKFIIEPRFDSAHKFSHGLALVADGLGQIGTLDFRYNYYFIDKDGNRAFPLLNFVMADSFSEGVACVKLKDTYGFIGLKGETVIPFRYRYGDGFVNGFAGVGCSEDKYTFIDHSGKQIADCSFKNAGDFSEGVAPVQADNGKWGFINGNGDFVIVPQFDDAFGFENGLAEVELNDGREYVRKALINHKGEYVTKLKKEKRD